MQAAIHQLKTSIQTTRENLLAHPVYAQIKDFEGMQKFAK